MRVRRKSAYMKEGEKEKGKVEERQERKERKGRGKWEGEKR